MVNEESTRTGIRFSSQPVRPHTPHSNLKSETNDRADLHIKLHEGILFFLIATLHSYKLVAIVCLWFEFYDCLGGGEGNFMSVCFRSIEVSYKQEKKTNIEAFSTAQ